MTNTSTFTFKTLSDLYNLVCPSSFNPHLSVRTCTTIYALLSVCTSVCEATSIDYFMKMLFRILFLALVIVELDFVVLSIFLS